PQDDPEAAKAFYSGALGFEVRQEVGYGDMHWITVGPPGQPGVNLVLHPPGADPNITEDERRTIREMMAKGTFASLLLATDDLDAAFQRLVEHDAELMQDRKSRRLNSSHVKNSYAVLCLKQKRS